MRHDVELLTKYRIEELTKENRDFVLEHIHRDAHLDNINEFIENKNVIAFFVRTDDDVFAFIHGYVLPRLQHRPMLYIHNMAVFKKHRHEGLGTLMMNSMLEYAKDNNLSKVFLITNKSNKSAVGLFKKEKGKVPFKDDLVFVWRKEDL